MDNLKKIILLSIIPALLTVFFIVQFTIPSVKDYLNLKKQIKSEKTTIKELKGNIERLKANKQLLSELNEVNSEIAGFDIEFPSAFRDEILLIDLEIFADETVNKIMNVESLTAQKVEIIDPEKKQETTKTRKKRKKEQEEPQPVTILEKPMELNTVAYYNEVIDFVTFLEDYQRKVNISSIQTRVFNDDKDSMNPRVDLKIKGSIYKSIENKNFSTPDENSKKTVKK